VDRLAAAEAAPMLGDDRPALADDDPLGPVGSAAIPPADRPEADRPAAAPGAEPP
jgi:hypothetical protein